MTPTEAPSTPPRVLIPRQWLNHCADHLTFQDESEMPLGHLVQVEKVGDTGAYEGHPIDTGYTLKGYILYAPVMGASFRVWRTERNGVERPGIFETTPVLDLIERNDGVTTIQTANSTYRITPLL